MIDYYLKAESEEALWEALENAGVVYDSLPVAGVDLDVIGTIWQPTGETTLDEDGTIVPVMGMIDGYHANLRCNQLPEDVLILLPIIEAPKTPQRVWF